MTAISIFLFGVLASISFLHLLWGMRIWIPVRNEKQLARTIAGFKGIEHMPSASACFIVALILLCFSISPLLIVGVISIGFIPPVLIKLATLGIALIFLGRGLIGYTSFWTKLTPEEPFRTYDRFLYAPLCLVLGLGKGYLLISLF